jgi:hypothetical protein
MTGKKVYKSLFEVESMPFCWADGLRSLQGFAGTLHSGHYRLRLESSVKLLQYLN